MVVASTVSDILTSMIGVNIADSVYLKLES